MKGGLAAALFAFRAFARSGVAPRRDILFAGTADEESGGAGAKALAESGFMDGVSAVVIGEPTGNALGLAAKGALWLRVKVTGRVSHGAYPEKGVNAIEGAMRFAERIRPLLTGSHPLLTSPTATVTGLHGGVKHNMVPDEAVLLMDIRTTPGISHAALIASCRELARGMAAEGLVIAIEVLNDRMAVTVSEDAPVVKALTESFETVLSRAPGKTGAAFFSDASIFLRYKPLDVVLFGPGESDQAHTPNERLSLAAFRESVQVYGHLIRNWAK
jgi:succinyl-diaminopimelate desuccinylase